MKRVSVCVPVFNGIARLPATLDSIAGQTHRDVRILLSVEPSNDDSLMFCRRAQEQDDRIVVFPQPNRLDFIGNVNFLIRNVDTEFFCITPQDDLLEPDYLSALLSCMLEQPGAALAYSDMDKGNGTIPEFQASLWGNTVERVIGYLARQMNHVEWRGLIRTACLPDSTPVPDASVIDHILPLRLAIRGDLIRVPRVLYHKTIHRASATADERATETGRIRRIRHALLSCLDCHAMAVECLTHPETRTLANLALMLRMQKLMEMTWPLHRPESTTTLELDFYRELLNHRLDDLFLVHDLLNGLSKHLPNHPRACAILEAETCLHLAILSEYTGNRPQAAYLAARAKKLDPGLAELDEFHHSVVNRLSNHTTED